MNRSYYYKKIIEKDVELEKISHYPVAVHQLFNVHDLHAMSDDDLKYLYENLKLRIKEVLDAELRRFI